MSKLIFFFFFLKKFESKKISSVFYYHQMPSQEVFLIRPSGLTLCLSAFSWCWTGLASLKSSTIMEVLINGGMRRIPIIWHHEILKDKLSTNTLLNGLQFRWQCINVLTYMLNLVQKNIQRPLFWVMDLKNIWKLLSEWQFRFVKINSWFLLYYFLLQLILSNNHP